MTYKSLSLYNKFANKSIRKGRSCMSKLLYNKNTVTGKLFCFFSIYFVGLSAPTAESLAFLLVSMLALESAGSIRSLYRHFLAKATGKSLNAFYYLCSYAKVDYSSFMATTARLALGIIPDAFRSLPVLLCVDDTIVPKPGPRIEGVSKLFDHAAHNGSRYLDGHCFVSLMLCVPVWDNVGPGKARTFSYLSVPLGYRMWQKEKTKLELAADMVRLAMPVLSGQKNVVALCDSWYAKKGFLCLASEFTNLDIICSARVDTALYGLPPARTGKRGRPAKRGARLSLDSFALPAEKIGGYYTGCQRVMTNLFGDRAVMAYVTSAGKDGRGRRLFLSTAMPTDLSFFCAWYAHAPMNQTGSDRMQYIPLFLYRLRWKIEVSYYEQKTFWDLCRYMLRSAQGIGMLVNTINLAYSAMKLLPYTDAEFAEYQGQSVQDFRFALSEAIREQLIFTTFAKSLKNREKHTTVISLLKQKVFGVNKAV